MNLLAQFHFLRPAWLWLLLPLSVIILALLFRRRYNSNWDKVCDPQLLPFLLTEPSRRGRHWPLLLASFAWLLAIIALAGPTWQKQASAIYRASGAHVIVLDMSPSMNANDIPPSRLAHAKYKVLDILKRNHGSRIGMVVFTSQAFTVSPLTNDANTISLLVPTLKTSIMPVAGHNIAAGLTKAAQLLKQGGASHGQIILLTDSNVTAHTLTVAETLRQQGLTLSVLGIGTNKKTPIKQDNGAYLTNAAGNIIMSQFDGSALAKLAAAGGGDYQAYTNSDNDINTLLKTQPLKKSQLTKQTSFLWQDQGRYFILLLVLIVAFGFRRGWLSEVLR